MRTRTLLVLLLFLVWGVFSWHWYTCWVKGFCGDEPKAQVENNTQPPEPEKEKAKAKPPLYFNLSDADAGQGPAWSAMRDSLAVKVKDGQKFKITGQYFSDEVNNTSFENLGIARAEKVKALFAQKIDPANILTEGKAISRDIDDAKDFKAATFSFVKMAEKPSGDLIKDSDRKATILFPFNSTNPILPADVQQYLDEVCEKAKVSGERVMLTGHTDDVGQSKANYNLGLKRANIVKNLMIKKGVKASQITAKSEGETKPRKPNDTDEGRRQNRRIEIEILKN